MQYCVSGSASNLITLIYPDLQVFKGQYCYPRITHALSLRAPYCNMHALALSALADENFIFLICKGILQCSIAYLDLQQI